MKKFTKLLIPAFAALVLTGCGKNDWFTLAPAAGDISSQGSGQQGGSSSQQGTSGTQQGGGGTSQSPSGDVSALEQIIVDVCNNIFGHATKGTDYEEEDGMFGTDVTVDGATSLQNACELMYSYLPSYLVQDSSYPPEADTWDDGSDGYFAYYVHQSNENYCCDLGSYLEEGEYGVMITVYDYSTIAS